MESNNTSKNETSGYATHTEKDTTLDMPKLGDGEYNILDTRYRPGDWEYNILDIKYRPSADQQPSWFNRKMMEVFFGGKWVKIPK